MPTYTPLRTVKLKAPAYLYTPKSKKEGKRIKKLIRNYNRFYHRTNKPRIPDKILIEQSIN